LRCEAKEAKWVEWVTQKPDWYEPTIWRENEFSGGGKYSENSERKKLEESDSF